MVDGWIWREQRNRARNQLNAKGRRESMRRLRATRRKQFGRSEFKQRELEGLREYWMIGYDGPRPQPGSWWPRMMEHAQRYGL